VTVIETERLRLRPLTIDDADALYELLQDDRVNHFVGALTRAENLGRLAAVEEQWKTRGHGLCAVELKSTGEFIGRAGLKYWDQFDEVETGWTFRADAWGHGYATEAGRAAVAWGFAHLDLDYITAMIRPGNTPSVKVAERLGFAPRRDDVLFDNPITVYALARP
jgi:RimJ/RimL family protein N-acetyltransferase